jgi:hypothetical protein
LDSWNGALATHQALSIEGRTRQALKGGVTKSRLTSKRSGSQIIVLNIQGTINVRPIATLRETAKQSPSANPRTSAPRTIRFLGKKHQSETATSPPSISPPFPKLLMPSWHCSKHLMNAASLFHIFCLATFRSLKPTSHQISSRRIIQHLAGG